MDSTSTVGSSLESTPQRMTPWPDFDNQSLKSDETLGGSLQTNQNRMAGTSPIEHKAVHAISNSRKKVWFEGQEKPLIYATGNCRFCHTQHPSNQIQNLQIRKAII